MSAEAENKPLTKSQKKRMKKKNKSAKAASADTGDDVASVASSVVSEVATTTKSENGGAAAAAPVVGSQLNSIDKMRADVMSKGYSFEEVDKAMSDMWELELAYDEAEAVLDFLKAKAGANVFSSSQKQKESNGFQMESDSMTMEMTVSNDSFTPDSKESHSGDVVQEGALDEDQPANPEFSGKLNGEVLEDISYTGATTGSSKAPPQAMPVTIIPTAAKLELVAGHENLHDAIYAMAEWTKSPKGQEASTLCAEGSIITILLKRAIGECSESEFVKLLPYLLNLLCSIFPPSNLTKTGYREGLTKVLNAARKAANSCSDVGDGNTGTQIANAISKALVHAMAAQVVAGAPSSSTSSSAKPQNDLGRLLQKRVAQKYAAEQAVTSEPKGMNGSNGGSGGSSLLHEHDPELEHLFSSNKSMHDKVLSEIDTVNAQYAKNKETTEEALRTCEKEQAKVAARKAELLAELQALEDQDAALNTQASELASSLDSMTVSHKERKEALERDIQLPKKVIKMARACHTAEESLASFEKSISKATPLSSKTQQLDPTDFFLKMSNYFATESELWNVMTTRVNALCARADKIEREMIECRNLGLSTNATQLEAAISEVTSYALEDKKSTDAIQKDALAMKDKLVAGTMELATEHNLQSHIKSMKTLEKMLISMQIPADDFAALIPESDEVDLCEHPVEMDMDDTFESPVVTSKPAPTEAVRPIGPPPTSSVPAKMPKLSWAAISAPAKPAGKSLLEIQNEERNAGR